MTNSVEIHKKETNSYFTHMGVGSSQEASILSNELTWEIIEILRSSGAKGLTPPMVLEKIEYIQGVKVSRSKVYALLKRLYEMEWVHRYYDTEEQANRSVLADIAGQVDINEDFSKVIEENMSRYIEKKLFPVYEEFLEKTTQMLNDNPKIKKWLPDHGKNSYCKKCKINHEATEFVDCLIGITSLLFIGSDNFTEIMKKKKFADEEYQWE